MAVGVDQAGQQRAALRIDTDGRGSVRVLHLGKGLDDLAVVADQQGLEPLQLAVCTNLDAVGVMDQSVGERGIFRRIARR